jgi:rhodanese-related sulfurtransferase
MLLMLQRSSSLLKAQIIDTQQHDMLYSLKELSPQELLELSASTFFPQIVDVREPWECKRAPFPLMHMEIPLGRIAFELDQLAFERDIVVVCHFGRRSAQACFILKSHGFENVYNLCGGIDAWAQTIDPQIPRY